MLKPAFRHLITLALLSTASLAHAGTVYFNLVRSEHKLTVTNLGNSSAFYPQPLRLLPDGQWQALPTLRSGPPPAELAGGAERDYRWPALTADQATHPLAALQPVMMRFYDQAGAAFGQISFFQQPPPVSAPLEAEYRGGRLHIKPPPTPRVTWLLWAQEEGITPLRSVVRFEHQQAAAKRIEWLAGSAPQSFDLGAGQPAAMLLHETAQGMELQILASGGLQGREQRAPWLDATPAWLTSALVLLVAALATLAWHWQAQRRAA